MDDDEGAPRSRSPMPQDGFGLGQRHQRVAFPD
jgi:hypothetical protein